MNNEKKFIKLTPFKMQVLQSFPFIDEDFDAITNYELLCKVVEYLNTTVDNVDLLNEKVEEFQKYFDNLDVQEEINNKLDEMAESGELTNLIKNYIDPIYQNYENEINEEINDFTSLFNSEINTLTNRVDGYSNNPIPVNNTSQMTDTTRIYLNTTNGYWYYYNGSEWTQGGLYQSAEILTDKTLTQANVPADAKIVGDYVLSNFTKYISRNILPPNNIKSGFITANGTYAESSTYYCLINPIDVSKYHGKTLYLSNDYNAKNMRFLCAYNSSLEAIETKGSNTDIQSYTVPNDIDYINISFTSPYATLQLEPDRITPRSTYFNKIEVNTNDNVKTNVFDSYYKELTIPTLDEIKSFDAIQNKKNFDINFFGKITGTFGGIRIGQGKNQSNGYNIHITPTQMSYQNGTTDAGGVNHGLTIKDYIFVNISIQNDGISHITINTNGGTYKRNVIQWLGSNKNIFVQADTDTTITDARLNYVAKDSKKFIWYFGDSYISAGETRLPYYLNELGYLDNIMLDGFAGANSAEVYPDVEELINNDYKPKYIIWALGMNNPDNNSINASWIAYLTYLWDLCNINNIQLILCTIPNCPLIDNTFKNNYIRNCGLPYIDYADAVNLSTTGEDRWTWYDGMLSNDNVHPTIEGARCLASKFITDFNKIIY